VAPVISNAPSEDRTRQAEAIEPPRVDARAFRQGWRVRTRLGVLFDDNFIPHSVYQAACEYRDCCLRLSASPPGPGIERTSGGADPHDRLIGLIDAASKVRAADRALGPDLVKLVRAVVVLDRSWRDLGRWLGIDRETARRAAVLALHALAAAWGATGQPEAPRRRLRAS
jgi:hypothetical protein